MTPTLTVGALLSQALLRLSAPGPAAGDQAGREAELILAHALGTSRARIITHPTDTPTEAQIRRFHEVLERAVQGEPLAYIFGYKEFWSLRLAVSPAVLVPRPETELLVERALALRPEASGRVADLGTGSGAIALALASERPQWSVTATDVSAAALEVARANAEALGLSRVEFASGRWLAPLRGRKFDLVVSNPPYIDEQDAAMKTPALRHEPQIALTPGPDGLLALREIVRTAPPYLEPGGWLLLEHGSGQASAVAHELVGCGFTHVRSHRDLAGRERVTEGCLPPERTR
ncbi:MAG TPA: peptide chain release factor N(5)-glutamine methyltransferase [Steroidobacteraceae bacterium]|jgi:release factor glutamine methyltransferase